MDVTKLITLTQEFMGYLESEYPEGVELVEVGIVVELRRTEDNMLHTPTACTNDSRVYQRGLWDHAYDMASGNGEAADDDVPPPPES